MQCEKQIDGEKISERNEIKDKLCNARKQIDREDDMQFEK